MSTARDFCHDFVSKLSCKENKCGCIHHSDDLVGDLSLGMLVSARSGEITEFDPANLQLEELNELLEVFCRARCTQCGHRVKFTLVSKTEYILSSGDEKIIKCPVAELDWNFEIAVPSGRLIIANDLRRVFTKEMTQAADNCSLGNTLSTWQHTNEYAKLKMIYAYVGNTSPSFFQDKNRIVFTNIDDDAYYNGDTDVVDYVAAGIGDYKGYVCTDLWAVTAMDYSTFIETATQSLKLGDIVAYMKDYNYTIVDVEPGIYKFDPVYSHLDNEDDEYNCHKLVIERLRDL